MHGVVTDKLSELELCCY